MQSKFMEKLIASMLALFLLIYVGVQAFRYFGNSVKTETVYEYTVAQSIVAKGLVFRDEQVLEETGTGIQSCLYEDGERVLVSQPVVEYLASAVGGNNRSRLRQTQWEIAMLEEAQNTSLSHFSNAEALGREIKLEMNSMVQMASSGRFDNADSVRANLTSLLNKRQIATGKERSFQLRIDALTREQESLASSAGKDVTSVVDAPVSGYYAKPLDGLEKQLTLTVAKSAGLTELLELIESAAPGTYAGAGRIVTSQNWYVAVSVEKYDVQWVKPGQTLTLAFPSLSNRLPATVERVVTSNESEEAVLVIHCNHVDAGTINLRSEEVRLEFSQHAGLRVDTAYLRFQNGERGVYVLENNTVRFRALRPIYEEDGFVLSQQPVDPYDTSTLRQYDQIIIKGTDLEDGKIME